MQYGGGSIDNRPDLFVYLIAVVIHLFTTALNAAFNASR